MIGSRNKHRHARGSSARPIRSPRERGTGKAFAFAVLMHLLLIWLLYHGINWQNNMPAGAEAEIWTEIPDTSTPTPRPAPPPPAPVKVQPAPPPVKDEEADIAPQEKKRKQQEAAVREAQLAEQRRKQEQQEAEAKRQQQLAAQAAAAAAQQKAMQEKQKQIEQQRQAELQKQQQQKAQQDKQRQQAEAQKQEQLKEQKEKEKKQQEAKAKAEAQTKAKADAEAKAKLDAERKARLAQLQGQLGGGTASSGEGLAKSGKGAGGNATSPGYAEKVQRRVRPNIVWAGETAGLETVVSVRCSPSGTLLSANITRSSGNEQWDQAALRAVQRSDPMPVDVDGKAPDHFTITLRPAGG
ncbi:MAG: TolA protein [uncultured Caballeronia sp.]|nr:MAG: TolA protein [uncultured Caballeronia sp.]